MVCGSLLLAFAQSPFLHVHEDDARHESGLAHAHWPDAGHDEHRDGEEQTVESDEHSRDRSLDWLAGDGKSSVKAQATPIAASVLAEPVAQGNVIPGLTTNNHDPPAIPLRQSRAPPA